MRRRPKTNIDLIEEGVKESRILAAWLKAEVEVAKRKRVCRICGGIIKAGNA